MKQRIANISLLVKDYDEAIRFYTEKLDFQLVEDTSLGMDKRWIRLSPTGARETCLLLAKAYGTVAVFKDLYGNLWDLIEPV
jgi:catechol 2,3-dioxygenase-like lactoylglutathione lyase family enzyme